MKLNTKQVDRLREQTGADPVPEDHPATEQLKAHFGDHTFYLSQEGLFVWESLSEEAPPEEPVTAVAIASWTDDQRTSLRPHEPKATSVVVELNPKTPKED